MAAMSEMLVMLPMLWLMNRLDFTDEVNIFYARIGFGSAVAICFCAWGYIYTRIVSANNKEKVKIPKTAAFGQQAEAGEFEQMTVSAYDMSQMKQALNQLAIGLLIISVLHYKWALIQPLVLQCVMLPLQLFKNPLCKIYVLGEKGTTRPFKAENPLSAFMPTMPEAPQTTAQTEQIQENEPEAEAEGEGEEKEQKETQHKKKKNKKKN